MENQHHRITGYRELTQAEVDLMNEIKAFGPQLQALCEKIDNHVSRQMSAAFTTADPGAPKDANELAERNRLEAADPFHWVHRGERTLQEALMFLTRAVAQPTTF